LIPKEFYLTGEQIQNIVDKVVPMIAKEEDHYFFRQMLYKVAYDCNQISSSFTYFIEKLLKEAYKNN